MRGRCLLLVSLLLGCMVLPAHGQACVASPEVPRAELASVLKRGGFSGVLDDSASVRLAGCLRGAGEELRVYYYERVSGSARRMTSRLIAVSNVSGYLGMYAVSGPPSAVREDRIVFPVPEEHGNVIAVRDGKLPRQVLIDGELLDLFK
jgi:hypothetical protein